MAVVLKGAGAETREDGFTVYRVSRKMGLVYITDGANPQEWGYDAVTGAWVGPDFGGFTRRLVAE